MPDLRDGESVEVQGSASRPYILKNVAGVLSCSCPAWRNQSLPIERRTCKHLRKLRGDAAEEARVGGSLPAALSDSATSRQVPALLLAETWDGTADPTGWWLSEKLDGVRAYWTGTEFRSRLGNLFHAPPWFTLSLPDIPLDGELWLGRKLFQRTVSIVRRQDQSDLWNELTFVAFDAPGLDEPFEQRVEFLSECLNERRPPHARALSQVVCHDAGHLTQELDRIEALGGEGVMLRRPGSRYEAGRSPTLLKVKRFRELDARVLRHQPGSGRHAGRLGALLVELEDGTTFAVGSGFTDAQRDEPPLVGSAVVVRYQELTDRGVPRFPTFAGVRADALLSATPNGVQLMKTKASSAAPARRFEFRDGTSEKFWQIAARDRNVTVRFGRIGYFGQSQTKSFPDAAAAARHVETLISKKVAKGYVETETK